MKLQIVSDLHMEFAPIEITNAGADILILSGDILVAEYFKRGEESPYFGRSAYWKAWFEALGSQFQHVIYVLGNHEHYNGNFYETVSTLRTALGHITNLHILDNEYVDIGDARFVGGTLWTDFGHDNLNAMFVRDALNDYKCVKGNGYRKLTTGETAFYHQQTLKLIDAQNHPKIVVVGHHAPSWLSIVEPYKSGRWKHLNPGYASHLDSFIEAHRNIVLWTHGHVHNSCDYVIGNTRVIANPRGYQKHIKLPPENGNFDPNLIVEI